MRINTLFAFTSALGYCACPIPAPAHFPFNLGRVANKLSSLSPVSIRVTTVGDAPAAVHQGSNWMVRLKGPKQFSAQPTVNFEDSTGVATLTLPAALFGTSDPSKFSWVVVLQDGKNKWDATQEPALPDTFGLGSASGKASGNCVTVNVRATGIAPAPSDLLNSQNWRVQAQDSDGNAKAVQGVEQVSYRINSGQVILTFPTDAIHPVNPDKAGWTPLFLPPNQSLSATAASSPSGALQAAKGRDDADLYISGGYIAGVGTKPIMILDVKLGYSDALFKYPSLLEPPPKDGSTPKGVKQPNLRLGFYGELSSNVGAQAPNDRSRIDPDSASAYSTILENIRLPHNALFYGLKWELQPAGGEFSRKYPESNFISGGKVSLTSELVVKKAWGLDLIPSVGFEGGTNLNKPSMLFGRPVDLSRYDGIARLRAGANAHLYIYRKIPSPGDDYAFTLTGSWIARVPFTPEPFTTYAYLPDPMTPSNITRQQTVALGTNTRHYVEVDAAWNLNKLLGFSASYKYGAQPPLFEFVDHQMSLGVLFKASYAHNHSVTNPLK